MKQTLTLLRRAGFQRLAGEVLADAQNLQGVVNHPHVAQMPATLQAFFNRYPPQPFKQYADKPTTVDADDANPFLPNKNPLTNKWRDPEYSLRRQSDLYKAAYRLGITHLLPPMSKTFYEEKYDNKSFVRGSQAFKLTKRERNAENRAKEIEQAVANADQLIAAARGSKFKKRLEKKKSVAKPKWY